jgi:hypothetical protein
VFCLKSLFSGRGGLETKKVFYESIALLNKNSLWIRFVWSISARQQRAKA